MTSSIEWRVNAEFTDLHEAYVEGRLVGWIHKRPAYCDRGHWQAQVEVLGLDGADAFPRYFMRFETAKQEMEEFLRWRLWKIPAPQLGSTGKFPDGKLHPGDEGELVLGVARDTHGDVHINFGKDISWLALPPEQAVEFAKLILRHAGAKEVVVKL